MWVMRSSFKLGNGISMENIDQSRLCQVDGIFVFAFWANSDGLFSYHINYCKWVQFVMFVSQINFHMGSKMTKYNAILTFHWSYHR